VAAAARGRGVGRGLLLAALHWLCGQRGLPRVSLTVRQDSAPALGLYEGCGFRRVASGAQMVCER
jgi:ribosomal protein S18 acetylase RimI-like enzyme